MYVCMMYVNYNTNMYAAETYPWCSPQRGSRCAAGGSVPYPAPWHGQPRAWDFRSKADDSCGLHLHRPLPTAIDRVVGEGGTGRGLAATALPYDPILQASPNQAWA